MAASPSAPGDKWFRNRKIPIEDKGMNFDPKDGIEDAFIHEIIEHHQWKDFAKQPGSFYVDLVTEFYNNLDKSTNVSIVRGVNVDYSLEKINKVYDLPDVDDKVTRAFLKSPNLDLMEETLCPFGATWGFDKKWKKSSILGINICYKSRAILKFVSSRLVPNTNSTNIFMNIFSIVYVICSKMDLNVGYVISENIKECRFKSKKKKWWFPSTITKLILDAGVMPALTMNPTASKIEITKAVWARMEDTYGPKKTEGEEESMYGNRRKQASVLPRNIMEFFITRFDILRAEIQMLMHKVERIEHIKMQEIPYNTTTIWALANFVKRMSELKLGYTEPGQFHQFQFVDPSCCPIPKFSNLVIPDNYVNMEQPLPQPEYAPPPPPPAPVAPVFSKTSSNIFAGLQDFSDNFDWVDVIVTNRGENRGCDGDCMDV
ncbi:hypothetical protein A4A49_43574 [Nicotiana attenuata]|uniref:Putative plant transposon protein domain-containing protein n=1 Tax=Nicotiana attenuata TaxID=49451 RepID=A0A1J6K985_NICAT|nr:hypothetical protein A4A49_43574 [Nicotiana attenuata]